MYVSDQRMPILACGRRSTTGTRPFCFLLSPAYFYFFSQAPVKIADHPHVDLRFARDFLSIAGTRPMCSRFLV